jgi:hypothetical protein
LIGREYVTVTGLHLFLPGVAFRREENAFLTVITA